MGLLYTQFKEGKMIWYSCCPLWFDWWRYYFIWVPVLSGPFHNHPPHFLHLAVLSWSTMSNYTSHEGPLAFKGPFLTVTYRDFCILLKAVIPNQQIFKTISMKNDFAILTYQWVLIQLMLFKQWFILVFVMVPYHLSRV